MADYIKNTVFIVADFGGSDQHEQVTKKLNLIKKSCSALGLTAQSAKDFQGGGKIITKIQKAIENAEFVICDISEPRGYPNPNVYYEFGYAHGCENDENDLFTICDRETFARLYQENKLPFDIQSEHIHQFGSDEELLQVVKDNLQYMIMKRDK